MTIQGGCTTQGADLGQTVRERFPISLAAGVIALVALVTLGGGTGVSGLSSLDTTALRPENLLMLLAVATVVGSALAGRHLIEALSYGIVISGFYLS